MQTERGRLRITAPARPRAVRDRGSRIARCSGSCESRPAGGILDILDRRKAVPRDTIDDARQLLIRVVQLLVGLITSPRSGTGTGTGTGHLVGAAYNLLRITNLRRQLA